jgi:hypothetical protein
MASASPQDVRLGDTIIVTGADNDTIGLVRTLIHDDENNLSLELNTTSGLKVIKVSDNNFIHIIKKANMLNLRKHNEYERDLKDMSKEDHQNEGRPAIDIVETSEKSNLPSSKISLSLLPKKISSVYYYVEDKGFNSRVAAEDYCDKNDYPYSKIQEEKD